jgi:CheY-like chemotaxis protein
MHTLFLVDDNTVDQFIMMTVLKKNPIFENIKRFDSGKSIIDHLNKCKSLIEDLPDVLFLDLSMPQFDGWDVLELLATIYDSLAKKINVYIISASINNQDRKRAFTYPFVRNFFSKPITSDNFLLIAADIEYFWNDQDLQKNI